MSFPCRGIMRQSGRRFVFLFFFKKIPFVSEWLIWVAKWGRTAENSGSQEKPSKKFRYCHHETSKTPTRLDSVSQQIYANWFFPQTRATIIEKSRPGEHLCHLQTSFQIVFRQQLCRFAGMGEAEMCSERWELRL